MATKTTTKRTAKGKKTNRQASIDKINAIQARLAEWSEEYSAEEIAFLTAEIQGYSDRNAQLIVMQCPTATSVRGYQAWITLGRRVNKGENGIAILAPAGSKVVENENGQVQANEPSENVTNDDGAKVRRFFRLAYVFDISQTHAISDEIVVAPESDDDEDDE